MDLLGYFRILTRRWVLILALTVVGGGLGVASTAFDSGSASGAKRTYYKATNTLVLDNTSQQSTGFQPSFANPDQIALLTTTGDVPKAVAKKLGLAENGQKLAERITTTVNGATATLEITAAAPTSDDAVSIADTFADQLVASLTQRDVDRYNGQKEFLSTRINNLTTTVNQLTGQLAGNPTDRVVLAQLNTAQNELGNTLTDFGNLTATGPPSARLSSLEQAQAVPINQTEYESRLNLGALGQNHLQAGQGTDSPTVISTESSTSLDGPVARGVLGALLGFLAGIGLALLLERLNRKVRTHHDAETAFGLPVLAEVPGFDRAEQRAHSIAVAEAPLSRVAEAYRAVRSSLLFTRALTNNENPNAGLVAGNGASMFEYQHGDPFVVMITSPGPGESKTTTTANLAAVFAEAGFSVLAVNCDFRRPALHQYFGLADEPRRVYETTLPGVKVVTNVLDDAAANPSQVVAAQRQVVASARSRFDVILLDTAPLLTANDAVDLVGCADLVLLVARAERTSFAAVGRATDLLNRLDAPLAGVVLAGVKSASNDYYYYYQPGRISGDAGPAAGRPSPVSTNGNGSSSDGGVFPPAAPVDGSPSA